MNWQVENGLRTTTRRSCDPSSPGVRMPDVLLDALPALVRDNAAIGREVAAHRPRPRTDVARRLRRGVLPVTPIRASRFPTGQTSSASFPPGTPYVLCVLRPTREFAARHGRARRPRSRTLTGGRIPCRCRSATTQVIVGTSRRAAPALRPRRRSPVPRGRRSAALHVDVRMESWLPADTIRRVGFGHVIVGRRHALIVERGVSFVAFDAQRAASARTAYSRRACSRRSPVRDRDAPADRAELRASTAHRCAIVCSRAAARPVIACLDAAWPASRVRAGPDATASRRARPGPPAKVRHGARLLRRLRAHLRRRRAPQDGDRARATAGQEARQDAVGVHVARSRSCSSPTAEDLFLHSRRTTRSSSPPSRPTDQATTPALFLAGKGNLTRDFTRQLRRGPRGMPAGTRALKLVPKRRQPDYDWLILVVDPAQPRDPGWPPSTPRAAHSTLHLHQPEGKRRFVR